MLFWDSRCFALAFLSPRIQDKQQLCCIFILNTQTRVTVMFLKLYLGEGTIQILLRPLPKKRQISEFFYLLNSFSQVFKVRLLGLQYQLLLVHLLDYYSHLFVTGLSWSQLPHQKQRLRFSKIQQPIYLQTKCSFLPVKYQDTRREHQLYIFAISKFQITRVACFLAYQQLLSFFLILQIIKLYLCLFPWIRPLSMYILILNSIGYSIVVKPIQGLAMPRAIQLECFYCIESVAKQIQTLTLS